MNKTLTENKVHLLYLDSLRGIAAAWVVLHHASLQISFTGAHLSVAQQYFVALFDNGHYPVNFFIVLSGYCLMIPVIKTGYRLPTGTAQFFRRRIKRILPPYYLAMLLSLVLIFTLIGSKTGTHWDYSIPVTPTDVITHILLIQDVFMDTALKINHVFWSISVEWRIYFLFPVLLYLWRKLGPAKTLMVVTVAVVVVLAALKLLHKTYPVINNNPNGIVPHYLLLFTLGMFGADATLGASQRGTNWPISRWATGLVTLTVILLTLAVIPAQYADRFPWQADDILMGIWSICLLGLCYELQRASSKDSTFTRVLSWKPLVLIGTFGYSLYLVHAPVLQLLTQYVLAPLQLAPFTAFVLLITVGFAVVLLFAYGFFLLCEKPFMTKKQPSLAVAAIVEPAL